MPQGWKRFQAYLDRRTGRSRTTALQKIERVIAAAAGIAAVFGIAFWFLEGPDRKEEREARQRALIAQANSILADAGARGEIEAFTDPQVVWAIDTLRRYKQDIVLRALTVNLSGQELDGVSMLISSDTLWLNGSTLKNACISWTGYQLHWNGADADTVLMDIFVPTKRSLDADLRRSIVTDTEVSIETADDTKLGVDLKTATLNSLAIDIGHARYRYTGVRPNDQIVSPREPCEPGAPTPDGKGRLYCVREDPPLRRGITGDEPCPNPKILLKQAEPISEPPA